MDVDIDSDIETHIKIFPEIKSHLKNFPEIDSSIKSCQKFSRTYGFISLSLQSSTEFY